MTKAFTFITSSTPGPNGGKVAVFLEELKAAYGLDFETKEVVLGKKEQKEPWFLKLNPNGRIPVLIDHQRNDFTMFESAAILLYLQDHYDTDNKFGFAKNSNEYNETLQWILFVNSGVGPVLGQASHFINSAPEKNEYAINKFVDEGKRVLGVLNSRLTDRDWLVGPGRGRYTIADMDGLPWFEFIAVLGVGSLDQWSNIKAWSERARENPAFRAGMPIYKPSS